MSIDYAHNAQERIKLAVKAPQVEGEVPALVLAQIAQAEATLALVEQQRIANLIAVRQMEGGPYKDINRWDNGDGADSLPLAIQQIREGLGL